MTSPMTKIYTLTIFTSAFLLFLIQPMISKLLLPHLGGTPALWNTSMMFFQMLLLLGYAYAHFSVKLLGARKQACLHILLLLAAIAWLPVSAHTQLSFSSVEHPILWVIASLSLSVGIPFFVLAANAPLLQSWLSHTSHKDAQNPYFLYSASNIGSLLALCSYPFIIEPTLTLPEQTHLWSAVFIGFIACITACIVTLRRHYAPVNTQAETTTVSPTLPQRLRWVALAFFPSSLLLGVTTYITTDIASLPLFWIIPLAMYLITFILAFARSPKMVDWALSAQVLFVPLTALALATRINHATLILALHLITFFLLSLGCHGMLARQKPQARYLTEYYLWMSFGGMLGGVFNAIIAPQLFTSLIEYPLILGLSLFCRPLIGTYANPAREKKRDLLIPAFILALTLGIVALSHTGFDAIKTTFLQNEWLVQLLAVFLCVIFTMSAASIARRPTRFALSFLALVLAAPFISNGTSLIYAERNFFGVNRVYDRPGDNATLLMHGTTIHGIQSQIVQDHLKLTSYYSPLSDVFTHRRTALKHEPVAVIGLGAGTLACLGERNQSFDYYEIDPAVAAIASNPKFFTYLQDCKPTTTIHLGDGRLEIAKTDDHHYGIMVIDAFSSDAIPVHLLTREALQIYTSKLKPGGILAFNISNRHLNLAPLMAALAKDARLTALIKLDAAPQGPLTTASVWVIMAKDISDFEGIEQQDLGWNLLNEKNSIEVWTDNYSNILKTLFNEPIQRKMQP